MRLTPQSLNAKSKLGAQHKFYSRNSSQVLEIHLQARLIVTSKKQPISRSEHDVLWEGLRAIMPHIGVGQNTNVY